MMILELHVLLTESDSRLADVADLPTVQTTDRCDHCRTLIGFADANFIGYALALTETDAGDEQYWYVCLSCAAPVVSPTHD
jgi:hypothetical protein